MLQHNIYFRLHKNKHPLIFILFLAIYGVVIPSHAANEKFQDFVCTYKKVTDYTNSIISTNKSTVSYLLNKATNQSLTRKEHRVLVSILMLYRLLPIQKNRRRCKYYSFQCIDHPSQSWSLDQYVDQWLSGHPQDLDHCYINSKRYPLWGKKCRTAIQVRIQPIPSSLVLAQAAIESAWGSSRFARSGLNLFGLQYRRSGRSKNDPKCLQARRRSSRCLFRFSSIEEGFFFYSQNLNTLGPYRQLRGIRKNHLGNKNISTCELSLKMADGLKSYAEDVNYIRTIKSKIRQICKMMNKCET